MKWNKRLFKLSNYGLLKISNKPLVDMLKHRQLSDSDFEGGGVILGRFIKDSKNIVIDIVTLPTMKDIRERYRFKRDQVSHQSIIDEIWKDSEGTCNYLGEWHTHPEKYPEPSSADIKSWKKILKEGVFYSRCLYFIVIGTRSIGVWEGDRRTLKIKKLDYE